jgi:hypothetical protein
MPSRPQSAAAVASPLLIKLIFDNYMTSDNELLLVYAILILGAVLILNTELEHQRGMHTPSGGGFVPSTRRGLLLYCLDAKAEDVEGDQLFSNVSKLLAIIQVRRTRPA